MSFNGLIPAQGGPMKPSDLRDQFQHVLGAGLPSCILPEDSGAYGFTMAPLTGLDIRIAPGRGIVGKKYHDDRANSDITLPARMACLIYRLKNTAKDSVTPTSGYVAAKMAATDIVDVNTVGFWTFAGWDGASTIANGAVGVNGNTVAVANALTKTGTVAKVDGHAGYAAQGDGSTGYFTSANSTGFPTGATEFEWTFLFTAKIESTDRYLFSTGTHTTSNNQVSPQILSTGNFAIQTNSAGTNDTKYALQNGTTYLGSIGYDGTNIIFKINGAEVYRLAATMAVVASVLYLLEHLGGTARTTSTLHYIELRNKMRTPAQLAALSNQLLLPCRIETRNVLSSAANAISGGDYDAARGKDKAFDGLDGTIWGSSQTDAAVNGAAYIGQSGLNINVTQIAYQMYINAAGEYYQTSLKAQWSIDGTTWYDITTFSGIPYSVDGQTVFFDVPTYQPTSYPHRFRLLANSAPSSSGGDRWYVRELKFYGDIVAGYSDIRSILPADSIALGMAKTSSTGLLEISHDYRYGRREGAYGGNRKVFLGWKYFSGAQSVTWQNPFGTKMVKTRWVCATTPTGLNETAVWGYFLNASSTPYGGTEVVDTKSLTMAVQSGGAAYVGAGWLTSGYIACYCEVID